MKHQSKKKRKKKNHHHHQQQPNPNNNASHMDQKTVLSLMEAFDSISFEEALTASNEANGDINKAANILAKLTDSTDDPSTSSVSSGFSGSSSASGSSSVGCLEGRVLNKRGSNKHKRVVAVTGTVSTVIGKEYLKGSPKRDFTKFKEFSSGGANVGNEDAEQFLCSMLNDDSQLNMAVVRDVLYQCGYDVEKALDVLLDLPASSYEQSKDDQHFNNLVNCKDDTALLVDHNESLTSRASDYTSHSAESEIHESIWGYDCRNYSQVLQNTEPPSITSRSDELNLPQQILESLFNISKISVHDPGTMNWRKVAKKMQSLGPAVDVYQSSNAVPQQAKDAEYHLFRQPAKEHWDSMKSCFQKAAVAYSRGDRQYASHLSDQGKVHTRLAQEADERASKNIFEARNKGIENVITIDFHGQHVKQAMRLLKLHLLFGTYVRSVQTLRVITGCGSHGLGKSKLKQSVVGLLEKEGIRWTEENRGTVLIKLDEFKEYSFLDSDSDTE